MAAGDGPRLGCRRVISQRVSTGDAGGAVRADAQRSFSRRRLNSARGPVALRRQATPEYLAVFQVVVVRNTAVFGSHIVVVSSPCCDHLRPAQITSRRASRRKPDRINNRYRVFGTFIIGPISKPATRKAAFERVQWRSAGSPGSNIRRRSRSRREASWQDSLRGFTAGSVSAR